MEKMKLSGLFCIIILWFGCDTLSNSSGDQIIVSVADSHLTKEELREIIPNEATYEDSVVLAGKYIDSWIKEHVILHYADNYLTKEQKDFDEELEKYRNSLMIYAYEKEFLRQNLDTVVSDEELRSYYQANPGFFKLKDNIVRVNYFVLPDSLENIREFEQFFYNTELEKSTELEQYCVDNNATYYLGENQWIFVSDLKEKMPLTPSEEKLLLQKNSKMEVHKNGKSFFVHTIDYKRIGEQAPLGLYTEMVTDIIVNNRKIETLNKLHKDIYLQAIDNQLIKKYESGITKNNP